MKIQRMSLEIKIVTKCLDVQEINIYSLGSHENRIRIDKVVTCSRGVPPSAQYCN